MSITLAERKEISLYNPETIRLTSINRFKL